MIVINKVTKAYEMGGNQVLALSDLNLRIDEGDFLAVTGPSGSGKSTLLYTVGGLLTPTKGDVTVNDLSIYKLTSRERAKFRRENVGFIFQSFELLPYLTALENVMLPLYLSGVLSAEQESAAQDALEEVGLANRAFHRPTELSGGEQQRVSIARGIVSNPTILLADEPTGNLDRNTGNEIMQLICRLHSKNELTVVVVTHDAAIAERASKRVEMIDGRIVEEKNN